MTSLTWMKTCLQPLAAGLPDCSGVALGIRRQLSLRQLENGVVRVRQTKRRLKLVEDRDSQVVD